MRNELDAIRSLKRFVAAGLGAQWEVRLTNEDGSMTYPYSLVAPVGPTVSTTNGLIVEVTQPLTVYCYPAPSESFEKAARAAAETSDALWGLFVGGEHPYRIPLYDYDGLTLDEPSDVRFDHDYLRLTDVQVTRVPDPMDEHRVIVVADFRARWKRSTDRLIALRGGPVVQSVRQRFIAEGAEQVVVVSGFDASNERFGRPRVSKA